MAKPPSGLRAYYDIKGGSIKGPGLDATIQRGGDSLLQRTDGWVNLDIYYPARTKEGEWLYVRYIGVMEGTDALAKGKYTISGHGPPALGTCAYQPPFFLVTALSNDPLAKSTGFDDQYMRVTPSIETASERLSWLNKATFIRKGKLDVTLDGTFRLRVLQGGINAGKDRLVINFSYLRKGEETNIYI